MAYVIYGTVRFLMTPDDLCRPFQLREALWWIIGLSENAYYRLLLHANFKDRMFVIQVSM